MESKLSTRELEEKVGRKFYGHEKLKSKYTPHIPESAEREYIRMTNQYMRILKDGLEEFLPELKVAYRKELKADIRSNKEDRMDSASGFQNILTRIFNEIRNRIISKTAGFGLRHRLENLAHLNRKLTVKEWKRAVKATLGIDIREDYYLGDFYRDQLEVWVKQNVDLIVTIPEDCLDKMYDIIYKGFTEGKTTTAMAKEIQKTYGKSKKHAEFIARDQTAKLNGQIQRAQQLDAGIDEYVWCSTGDERVRDSHKALNGKTFSWNDPPLTEKGRRCHPGEDYGCRCIGRPVFNRMKMSLPVENEVNMTIG